jgi:hypothetical protein
VIDFEGDDRQGNREDAVTERRHRLTGPQQREVAFS